MSNRYKVTGAWSPADTAYLPFVIEEADMTDTRNGHLYIAGANRVIDHRTGKPAKTGKGGTVPFKGETAWMDAARLAGDLLTAERYAR